MTAAQLADLAGLAAYAAGFYAKTNPSAARMFGDTALRADMLSAELGRDEAHARDGSDLAVVNPDITDAVSL
jgi:hypothetical protein